MAADYKAELQKLLREMFQFNHAELDFGIYRIMNQKRAEVERFIQKDLIEAVDDAFKDYETANRAELERELEELKKQVRENIGPDVIDDDGRVKEEHADIALVKKYLAKKAEVEEAGATDTGKPRSSATSTTSSTDTTTRETSSH